MPQSVSYTEVDPSTELTPNTIDTVPSHVLNAFNITGSPVHLAGGMGTSFLVASTVLKPLDPPIKLSHSEATWSTNILATIYNSTASLPTPSFRIPQPIHSTTGSYIIANWTATAFITGHHLYEARPSITDFKPWKQLLTASRSFHALLSHIAAPDFIAQRNHSWAIADRVAWRETSGPIHPILDPILSHLLSLRRDFKSPPRNQVVHCDLSGNVLFAEGEVPAIIDFTPYWRPVGYAEAVVVTDGMVDFGLGQGFVEDVFLEGLGTLEREETLQMLVRGLIFRLVAHSGLRAVQGRVVSPEEAMQFENAVDVLEGLLS